ncbi:hypothetical protein [Photobacterium aquae]|uniref:hypothetical protein n=1 Tax=Photobacterium aquae TaxID=1195763 RepID=UPI0012ED8D7B|nr:hypothetical protein [Photobacterium aquae]
MAKRLAKRIVKGSVWCVKIVSILAACWVVFFFVPPYLVTAEYYEEPTFFTQFHHHSVVRGQLPVVIERQGVPMLMMWRDYRDAPQNYSPWILAEKETLGFSADDGNQGHVEVSRENHRYYVHYFNLDYEFWSEYRVDNTHLSGGQIVPLHFRLQGPFIMMPIILLLLVLYCVGKICRVLFWRNSWT